MSGSITGEIFRIATFGESHGPSVGVVVDGVPSGLELSEADIQHELERRRPGQSAAVTARAEDDAVQIMSGVFEGKTTGTPIMMLVMNRNARSGDYEAVKNLFRPGHADYTYFKKYGIRDYRGGGRASGRETVGRVAAGAVAKKILALKGIRITAFTLQAAAIACETIDLAVVEKNSVRAADLNAAEKMLAAILAAKSSGNSVGGVIECRISGVPAGLGEPVFDKLDADLAKAVISIGGIKGIEFGAGFAAAAMTGIQHNDAILPDGFATNNAGGIIGGISSGQEIVFRVAVKPTASIAMPQNSIDEEGRPASCRTEGRHDPCLCPRIVPVVEAMSAIVVVDHLMRQAAAKIGNL